MREASQQPPERALVVVGDFGSPIDAELARTALEVAGVAATLESFAPIDVASVTGRAILRVSEADAERAQAILERVRAVAREREHQIDAQAEVLRCPRCELPYTTFGRWRPAGSSALAALYLLPVTLASRRRYRCQSCGHAWDDPAESPATPTLLEPGDPKPVFRMQRSGELGGVFLGIIVGVVLLIALDAQGPLRWVALGAPVSVGFLLGRGFSVDLCSLPSCRAVLSPGAEACSSCGGTVAGRVSSSAEHWAMAAEVRRELAAERGAAPARRAKKRKARAGGGP